LKPGQQTLIIIKILGGLGNQLFQYAFAYSLARRTDSLLKSDIQGFENYDLREFELQRFNIVCELASKEEIENLKYKAESPFGRLLRKLRKRPRQHATSFHSEPHFQFSKSIFDLRHSAYLDGYWQSEKYFRDYREELLDLFSLKNGFTHLSRAYLQDIEQCASVALHIRRGDYVTDPITRSYHGRCDPEYYANAAAVIQQHLSNPHFFIFSDDLHWAKANLGFLDQFTFVESEDQAFACEEMILMSRCRHNIIANSSFSWWAAWLNKNPRKMIITPKQWFTDSSVDTSDLLPGSWIQL
jgi:hypothetical protein